MNREQRLRKAIPGADSSLIGALAQLPAEDVSHVVTALRQARRDERQHQAELKRQRKADDRANGNHDENSFTRRNLAVIASQGERARAGNLDALTGLGQVRTHIDEVIGHVVEGCRAEGLSDKVIADALGVTRQAVSQRWPRQEALPLAKPAHQSHG